MKRLIAISALVAATMATPHVASGQAAATGHVHRTAAPVPIITTLTGTGSTSFITGVSAKTDGTVLYVDGAGVRKMNPGGTVSTIKAGANGPRDYITAFVSGGGVFAGRSSDAIGGGSLISSPADDGYAVYKESNGTGLKKSADLLTNLGLDVNTVLQGLMTSPSGNVYASTFTSDETARKCTTKLYKLNSKYTFELVRSAVKDLVMVDDGEGGYLSWANCVSVTGAVDDAGNAYDRAWITNAGTGDSGRAIQKWAADGTVSYVAGNGATAPDVFPEGSKATDVGIGYAYPMATGPSGVLYYLDGSYIRQISSTGVLSTVAGVDAVYDPVLDYYGSPYSGDGGPAKSAGLGNVQGLSTAPNGDLYVVSIKSDSSGATYLVRRIDMNPILAVGSGTPVAIAKKPAATFAEDIEIAVNGKTVTVGLKTPKKASGAAGSKKEIVKYTVTLTPSKNGVATVTKFVSTSSTKAVKLALTGVKKNAYTISISATTRGKSTSTWKGPKITLS